MSVIADLHVHTSATDGRCTAAEVIEAASRARLRFLVITDHSTVTFAGLPELAARSGVTIPFPGVEISTYLGDRRYHLVGYGAGLMDPQFQAMLTPPLAWKNQLAQQVRDALVAAGRNMPELDVIRASSKGPRRPTPDRVLVSRSAIACHLADVAGLTFDDAYTQVKNVHRQLDLADRDAPDRLRRRYLPTLEMLAAGTARRIVFGLAHPLWRCRDEQDVEDVCADLAILREHGLAGLETRSYHHRAFDDHPLLLRAAHGLGLLRCAGSDYHANGKTTLGADGLDMPSYAALAEIIDRRPPGAPDG